MEERFNRQSTPPKNEEDIIMKNLMTVTAVLCAAGLTATVALADQPPSVRLEIYPAELHQPGVQKLYERIENAAWEVCTPSYSRELEGHLLLEKCVKQAVSRAVAQIHSSELTEIHLAHEGSSRAANL